MNGKRSSWMAGEPLPRVNGRLIPSPLPAPEPSLPFPVQLWRARATFAERLRSLASRALAWCLALEGCLVLAALALGALITIYAGGPS